MIVPKIANAEKETRVETSREKLIRLANKRVPKAQSAIALVGNLIAYDPTPQDITKLETLLTRSVTAAIARLRGQAKTEGGQSIL